MTNDIDIIKVIAKQMLFSLQDVAGREAWYNKKFQEANTVFEVMSMLKKEYRLSFLDKVRNYISQEEYSINLVRAYVDTESPDTDLDMNKDKLLEMFKRTSLKHSMTAEDKDILQSMSDKIIIYRGISDRKYIFALTNRRQEAEIILDPNYLSNIQVIARFSPEISEDLIK